MQVLAVQVQGAVAAQVDGGQPGGERIEAGDAVRQLNFRAQRLEGGIGGELGAQRLPIDQRHALAEQALQGQLAQRDSLGGDADGAGQRAGQCVAGRAASLQSPGQIGRARGRQFRLQGLHGAPDIQCAQAARRAQAGLVVAPVEDGVELDLPTVHRGADRVEARHAIDHAQPGVDVAQRVRAQHDLFDGEAGAGIDQAQGVQGQGAIASVWRDAGGAGWPGQHQQGGVQFGQRQCRIDLRALEAGVAQRAAALQRAAAQRQLDIGDLCGEVYGAGNGECEGFPGRAADLYFQVLQGDGCGVRIGAERAAELEAYRRLARYGDLGGQRHRPPVEVQVPTVQTAQLQLAEHLAGVVNAHHADIGQRQLTDLEGQRRGERAGRCLGAGGFAQPFA